MIGSADLAPIILIIVFAAIIIMWRDEREGFSMRAVGAVSANRICPEGTLLAGSVIRAEESCDQMTCWDGVTKVTNAAMCPPQVTCWDGVTKVTNAALCPPKPMVPAPAPVPVPVPAVQGNCATVDDINRLIKALGTGPKPAPAGKGFVDEDVAIGDTTKEDVFTECPDGSFVKRGGVCGKDKRIASDGWFSLKFGPTNDQVWVDAESTRLRTKFPPGTPFKFLIENDVAGQAVFTNAKTVAAYNIKITGPAAKKIVRGQQPERAITTEIYAVTLAVGRATPNKLMDASGKPIDIKKETLDIYTDANFKSILRLTASGAAFKRVSTAPGWVYFRVGTASGAAKGSPYFRMRRVAGAAVKEGLLPLVMQQYQESRQWWVPQLGPTPYIPMNKRITILELKPQWQNADVLKVLKGEITKGVKLPDALISSRFVPQKTIKGTGAGQYQEVFDQDSNIMGKYYIKTNKFELPGLMAKANLRCPPGRPMRKNTSCGPKKP